MHSLLIIILVFIISCTKKLDTPEATLEHIVSQVVKGESVAEFFTQESDVSNLAPIENIRDLRVKILTSSCKNQDNCQLVYLIKYDQFNGENRTDKIEIKKVADMVKENEKWTIANVIEMKTFIDSKSPIEVK